MCRQTHGFEDTYAFACMLSGRYVCATCHYEYRTFCMDEQERARKDDGSLEYLLWRMTRQNFNDRLHDIDEMLEYVPKITHILASR